VAWRVLPVRSYAVRRSLEVLVCRGPGGGGDDEHDGIAKGSSGGGGNANGSNDKQRHIIPEVLPAAAWIVGEYSHLLPEALETEEGSDHRYDSNSIGPYHALIQSMTAPTDAAGVNPLPATTQAVFVQNAAKVFSAACERNNRQQTQDGGVGAAGTPECTDDELRACVGTLMKHLVVYYESPDAEVKERAFTAHRLLLSVGLPSDESGALAAMTVDAVASACRSASSTLAYLLTPEPMRPISAKAQKRKLAEGPPSPVTVTEWEEDVNWSVFSDILNEETPWFDADGNAKGSADDISFTKQFVGKGSGTTGVARNLERFVDREGPMTVAPGSEMTSFGTTVDGGGGGAMDSAFASSTPANARREGDPFYLPSSTTAASTTAGRLLDTTGAGAADATAGKDAASADAARFDSIQLESGDDSDEGGYAAGDGSRSAKRKKKKKKKLSKKVAAAGAGLKLVESDDSDDDDDAGHSLRSPRKHGRSANKQFQDLALVDLTIPLGEDEVLPRNEHYVVPERPAAAPEPTPTKSSRSKKKEKRKKKSKTKKRNEEAEAEPSGNAAVEGDLLGFDTMTFGPPTGGGSSAVVVANDAGSSDAMAMTAMTTMAPPAAASSDNAINNAFDDLLGLEMPAQPMMESTTVTSTATADNNTYNGDMLLAMEALTTESTQEKSKMKKPKKEKKEKKKKSLKKK